MSQISAATKATQIQIAKLQSDLGTLQQAARIMGETVPAKATPKQATAQPKTKVTAKPKRSPMTAAQRTAVGKRMEAYWAKRKKASAYPQPTQKRTRKPMSAAAKKALSKRMKASWAKGKKAKG